MRVTGGLGSQHVHTTVLHSGVPVFLSASVEQKEWFWTGPHYIRFPWPCMILFVRRGLSWFHGSGCHVCCPMSKIGDFKRKLHPTRKLCTLKTGAYSRRWPWTELLQDKVSKANDGLPKQSSRTSFCFVITKSWSKLWQNTHMELCWVGMGWGGIGKRKCSQTTYLF